MTTLLHRSTGFVYPDLPRLTEGLSELLAAGRAGGTGITVLRREKNPWGTTSPSEIVTCRLRSGLELRLFCKYGLANRGRYSGSAAALLYEGEVYQSILRPLDRLAIECYGSFHDPLTRDAWLVLECLDQETLLRVSDVEDGDGMRHAACRLGEFHRLARSLINPQPLPFLRHADIADYGALAQRVASLSRPFYSDVAWLPALCERFEQVAEKLLQCATVIHGDFNDHHVFFVGGTIYAIDWETAAIAAGEHDLAALIDGWPADAAAELEREYCLARWPDGAPADFLSVLDAARIWFHLHWLTELAAGRPPAKLRWRLAPLYAAANRLGLV